MPSMPLSEIQDRLQALLPKDLTSPLSTLFSSAQYALLSGGKRLRPLLTVLTAEAYGAKKESALDPACALELIHTYSLIHDDLPCMDDDDLRRGQPTLHKAYPEWQALLTGDYLLTYAFQILSEAPGLSERQKIELIQVLSANAGAYGLIGGQVMDLLYTPTSLAWPLLEQIHRCKTGALFSTALEFGAIIAEAPHEDRKTLQEIGYPMGLAFQIADDLLDAESGDIGKTTAVSLLGKEGAEKKVEDLLALCLEKLTTLSRPTPSLATLFERMIGAAR